jgi:hypothetical protein
MRLYKEETLSARDRYARRFGARFPGDRGTILAARIDMAMALMSGFPSTPNDTFQTNLEKLEIYKKDRRARITNVIASMDAVRFDLKEKTIDFDYVPMIGPMAFVLHRRPDDSYAIGMDEGLREIFAVLTLAALHSTGRNGIDLRFYDYYFESVFRLNYWAITDDLLPNEDFVQALQDLSLRYRKMEPSLRAFVDDLRDRAIDFVIYHELAHVALGHFDNLSPRSMGILAQHPNEISAFATQGDDFSAEFAADAFAVELMVVNAEDDRARFTAWQAPIVAMTILKHLQARAGGSTELARMMRASHPPMEERLKRVRALCLEHRDDNEMATGLMLQIADAIKDYAPDPMNRLFEAD